MRKNSNVCPLKLHIIIIIIIIDVVAAVVASKTARFEPQPS
jgi:hypothetical protein